MILCSATFIAILARMQPMSHGLDTPATSRKQKPAIQHFQSQFSSKCLISVGGSAGPHSCNNFAAIFSRQTFSLSADP